MRFMAVWLVMAGCLTSEPDAPAPAPAAEAPAAPAPAEVEAAKKEAVTRAAAVAKAIDAGTDPAEAMASEGLDETSFRSLLYDIAADPALTKMYADARTAD